MPRSLFGWPWWVKSLIALIVLVGVGFLRLNRVASNAMQSLLLIGSVEFDEVEIERNGDIQAKNVRIRPWAGNSESEAIQIELVWIDTPGWGWLLRSAFTPGGSSRALRERAPNLVARALDRAGPDASIDDIPAMPRVHARFERVVFPESLHGALRIDGLPGLASGSVFESAGCGRWKYWTEHEIDSVLNLPSAGVDIELDVSAKDSRRVAIELHFDAPGRSSWSYQAEWLVPHDGNLVLANWREAKIITETVTVRDAGFVAKRNVSCAKRERLDLTQFIDQHLDSVQRRLLTRGLLVDSALIAEYRSFVAEGGHTLTWTANPAEPIPLTARFGDAARDTLPTLNAQIRIDDRNAVPFTIHRVDPVPDSGEKTFESPARVHEIVASAMAALPRVAVSSPTESAKTTPPDSNLPTMVVNAASTLIGVDGQVPTADRPVIEDVNYEDLKYMIGERVIVYTTRKSRREGELRSFGQTGIELALRDRNGVVELEIPRATIRSVQVVWTKTQTAAAAAAADKHRR